MTGTQESLAGMAWRGLRKSPHRVTAITAGDVVPLYICDFNGFARRVSVVKSGSSAWFVSEVHPASQDTEVRKNFTAQDTVVVPKGTPVVAVQLVGPSGQPRGEARLMAAITLGLNEWSEDDLTLGPYYLCVARRCLCGGFVDEDLPGPHANCNV